MPFRVSHCTCYNCAIIAIHSHPKAPDMVNCRYRYEIAEEVLRNGGSDEEIQQRIMEAFPDSRENSSRATWYRNSWVKYGHCRGQGDRDAVQEVSEGEAGFVTYENYRNPHVTIHVAGCGQIAKRGGQQVDGQGKYEQHPSLAE